MTIIPEAGIASWYDYYRCCGLNVSALGWQGDDLDTLAKYCFSRKLDAEDYANCGSRYEAAAQKLTDAQATQRPDTVTAITVNLDSVMAQIPMVEI